MKVRAALHADLPACRASLITSSESEQLDLVPVGEPEGQGSEAVEVQPKAVLLDHELGVPYSWGSAGRRAGERVAFIIRRSSLRVRGWVREPGAALRRRCSRSLWEGGAGEREKRNIRKVRIQREWMQERNKRARHSGSNSRSEEQKEDESRSVKMNKCNRSGSTTTTTYAAAAAAAAAADTPSASYLLKASRRNETSLDSCCCQTQQEETYLLCLGDAKLVPEVHLTFVKRRSGGGGRERETDRQTETERAREKNISAERDSKNIHCSHMTRRRKVEGQSSSRRQRLDDARKEGDMCNSALTLAHQSMKQDFKEKLKILVPRLDILLPWPSPKRWRRGEREKREKGGDGDGRKREEKRKRGEEDQTKEGKKGNEVVGFVEIAFSRRRRWCSGTMRLRARALSHLPLSEVEEHLDHFVSACASSQHDTSAVLSPTVPLQCSIPVLVHEVENSLEELRLLWREGVRGWRRRLWPGVTDSDQGRLQGRMSDGKNRTAGDTQGRAGQGRAGQGGQGRAGHLEGRRP
eukprot:765616-Hanusia_phi.AAC.5